MTHKQLFTNFVEYQNYFSNNFLELSLIGASTDKELDTMIRNLYKVKYIPFEGDSLDLSQLSIKLNHYELFANKEYIYISKIELLSEEVKLFLIDYSKKVNPLISVLLSTTNKQMFKYTQNSLDQLYSLDLFNEQFIDKEKRLVDLLIGKANELDIRCNVYTAKFFLSMLANNEVSNVLNEFDKLLCLIGTKKALEVEDIRTFVTKENRVSIWSFRDAILKRHLQDAYKLANVLIKDKGEDPLGLIHFLRIQCMFGIRSIEDNLEDRKVIIYKEYGIYSLHQAISYLFYAETLIKKNMSEPLHALQTLIVRMVNA